MKDFLGRDIQVDDFIAYPAGGNRATEYGMIMGKVLKFTAKGISVERLDTKYEYDPKNSNMPDGYKVTILRKKVAITNLNKVVVIEPTFRAKQLWEHAELEPVIASKWIHGSQTFELT